jgi:hypothetical protein
MKTALYSLVIIAIAIALILAAFAPKIAIYSWETSHQDVTTYSLYWDGQEIGGIDLFTDKIFYCEFVSYARERRPCSNSVNSEIFSVYKGSRG